MLWPTKAFNRRNGAHNLNCLGGDHLTSLQLPKSLLFSGSWVSNTKLAGKVQPDAYHMACAALSCHCVVIQMGKRANVFPKALEDWMWSG